MRSERMGGGKGGGLPPALGGSVRMRPGAQLTFSRGADYPVRLGVDQSVEADKIVRAPITHVGDVGKM
jgi:hypothetical protein